MPFFSITSFTLFDSFNAASWIHVRGGVRREYYQNVVFSNTNVLGSKLDTNKLAVVQAFELYKMCQNPWTSVFHKITFFSVHIVPGRRFCLPNPARSGDSTLRQTGLLKGGSVVNSRLAVAKAENSPVSRGNWRGKTYAAALWTDSTWQWKGKLT